MELFSIRIQRTFQLVSTVSVEVTAVFHFPFQACEGPIDVIQRCHMNMP